MKHWTLTNVGGLGKGPCKTPTSAQLGTVGVIFTPGSCGDSPEIKMSVEFGKSIYMASTLKQELIDRISATEDENLLQLLKNDDDYFTSIDKPNVTDELSPEDLEELKSFECAFRS